MNETKEIYEHLRDAHDLFIKQAIEWREEGYVAIPQVYEEHAAKIRGLVKKVYRRNIPCEDHGLMDEMRLERDGMCGHCGA